MAKSLTCKVTRSNGATLYFALENYIIPCLNLIKFSTWVDMIWPKFSLRDGRYVIKSAEATAPDVDLWEFITAINTFFSSFPDEATFTKYNHEVLDWSTTPQTVTSIADIELDDYFAETDSEKIQRTTIRDIEVLQQNSLPSEVSTNEEMFAVVQAYIRRKISEMSDEDYTRLTTHWKSDIAKKIGSDVTFES